MNFLNFENDASFEEEKNKFIDNKLVNIYRKCECGLYGDCFDPDKWCNCDSGHDGWLYDGGELMVS
jgi:hypothetical protein